MIELKDDDGFIVHLDRDKISAFGVRPATKEEFFVKCDQQEYRSYINPHETFKRFQEELNLKPKIDGFK